MARKASPGRVTLSLVAVGVTGLWLASRHADAASLVIGGASGTLGTYGIAGNPGQDGGVGGAGEPAVADVTSSDSANSATASGGDGGSGGNGGSGIPIGSPSGAGGGGGAGGAATASAVSSGSGNPSASATAFGGRGGDGGDPGSVAGGGIAGAPGVGGVGGAASARATADASGLVAASAEARAAGGNGGNSRGVGSLGGDGGAATASASVTGSSGDSFVAVHQTGGSGGAGEARAGRGADSLLDNAALSSSTIGAQVLQEATGGAGGDGPGSTGGAARSVLHGEAPGSRANDLTALAHGGFASSLNATSDSDAARGGDASAGVTATDQVGASIAITVEADGGGALGPYSRGGTGSLEFARGVSTAGGGVSVSGTAKGGFGDYGASEELVDAVSAETSGGVSLEQTAVAGKGGLSGGHAVSRLHRTGSHSGMILTASATGGSRSDPSLGDGVASDEGTALAEAEGESDGGGVSVETHAIGGNGGGRLAPLAGARPGADATAIGNASTSGDGRRASVTGSALGGDGEAASDFGLAHGGRGGTGRSTSRAQATGDSEVQVSDSAQGGAGDTGGDAFSTAVALGGGTSLVAARAQAIAGAAVGAGDSGFASADATASGLGEVTAGSVGGFGKSSIASAHALSTGSVRQVDASIAAQRSSTVVISGAEQRAALPRVFLDPAFIGVRNLAVANAHPSDADVATWTDGHPTVQTAIAASSEILAVGLFSADGGVTSGHSSIHLELAGALPAGEDLVLGFLGATSSSGGFDALHLELDVNGAAVFARDLTPDQASAELSDHTLVIASGAALGQDPIDVLLQYDYSFSLPSGAFVNDFVLYTTPEPFESALVVVGVLALALRRRQS